LGSKGGGREEAFEEAFEEGVEISGVLGGKEPPVNAKILANGVGVVM